MKLHDSVWVCNEAYNNLRKKNPEPSARTLMHSGYLHQIYCPRIICYMKVMLSAWDADKLLAEKPFYWTFMYLLTNLKSTHETWLHRQIDWAISDTLRSTKLSIPKEKTKSRYRKIMYCTRRLNNRVDAFSTDYGNYVVDRWLNVCCTMFFSSSSK